MNSSEGLLRIHMWATMSCMALTVFSCCGSLLGS